MAQATVGSEILSKLGEQDAVYGIVIDYVQFIGDL